MVIRKQSLEREDMLYPSSANSMSFSFLDFCGSQAPLYGQRLKPTAVPFCPVSFILPASIMFGTGWREGDLLFCMVLIQIPHRVPNILLKAKGAMDKPSYRIEAQNSTYILFLSSYSCLSFRHRSPTIKLAPLHVHTLLLYPSQ